MKIKIENIVVDGRIQPVMVILTEEDKENIRNMHSDCTKYCVHPSKGYTAEEIEAWMEEV